MSLQLKLNNDSSEPMPPVGAPVIITDVSDRTVFALRKVGDLQRVIITDIDMSIGAMCRFMIKWAIASIPAFIILFILGAILGAIFMAISHM